MVSALTVTSSRGVEAGILRCFPMRLGPQRGQLRSHAKRASAGAHLRRVVTRTWRLYPLIVVAAFGVTYLFQFLIAPSTDIPLGSTATMTILQGPPVLVTVRSLSFKRATLDDRVEREARFYVEMRLRDPQDSMGSEDALASLCSVLGHDGVVYPSDLSRSEPEAAQGMFELGGSTPREGWVVAYIPAEVKPAGVTCQLGDEVEDWLLR